MVPMLNINIYPAAIQQRLGMFQSFIVFAIVSESADILCREPIHLLREKDFNFADA
jgi:hypothetical protein